MDIRVIDAAPTAEERQAVDACIGPPASSWDGATERGARDYHLAYGGQSMRDRRHQLLPALRALQARVGWISEGGLAYVCERLDVPPADAWGVATFYALLSTTPRARRVLHVCDDIACKCRGADALCAELESKFGPAHAHGPEGDHVEIPDDAAVWVRSPCLGMCDHAPAAMLQVAGETPVELQIAGLTARQASAMLAPAADPATAPAFDGAAFIASKGEPRLLKRVGKVDPASIDGYTKSGGFEALEKALGMTPPQVVAEVTASKLMGRGGAAFPMGRKWEAVAAQAATPHFFICNADESEPGTFKDRVLMEGDPYAIIEAMTIGAYATGCAQGFIYLRGEYPLAAARLQHAIDQSRTHGFLGADILGRGFSFDIEIRQGGGAYICGEETAIFNSIEGYRGEPRNKPPFPVQAGLFGCPTVVNNVETLANVPGIILDGGAAYANIGTENSTGTKLFCISGAVEHPGVVEVPFGATLGEVIDLAGGIRGGTSLKAVLLGGAAGVFVRPDELDIPLTFEGVRAANATLGSGVIIAFDESADMEEMLLRIAAFFRDESCGQCVPCRVGTVRQEEALHRIRSGRTRGGLPQELALIDEVGMSMKDASICGLGQTAYSAIESAIKRLGVYGERP
ncbi:MAG TPA: NAD(P)H-dependent oxidoreductase subunit E [Gemmatimonadaceae bacterium]|nr:NAD(P)H-dependent oxidoreductase subunit E [Gemmatimonadaceae bacterium]